MDDNQLVDLFLKRDEAALSVVSEKYGKSLRRIANNIVEDPMDAEECENSTYLTAWESIPPHEPRNYLFPYLARIIRHISLDLCRKRNRIRRSAHFTELTAEMEQCIPAPNDTACQMDGILLGEVISSFLWKLSEEQRNVFLRRYWYLDPVSDIAGRFSFSESKVKTMLFRIRTELKEYLLKEGYML